MPDVKIDQETLSKQNDLTEEQQTAIAEETLKELEGNKEKETGSEEVVAKKEETKGQEKLEEAKKEGEEKPLTAEQLKAEEERIFKAEEKDLSEEDKGKKTELLKLRGDEKAKTEKTETEGYARERGITVEDAKKELESINKLSEKYQGDSKKILKALYHSQQTHGKMAEEVKAIREGALARQQEITVPRVIELIDKGGLEYQGKKATRENVIEAYRQQEPELTANMEDEAVLRLASKQIIQGHENAVQKFQAESIVKAKEKREQLISILPESDRRYITDIAPVLDKIGTGIMSDSFSLNDTLLWAKGLHYDEDLKAHGDKEYQRGLAEAKILGVRSSVSKGSPASASKSKVNLSEAEKEEALRMYDGLEMKDEEKFEAYAELQSIGKK